MEQYRSCTVFTYTVIHGYINGSQYASLYNMHVVIIITLNPRFALNTVVLHLPFHHCLGTYFQHVLQTPLMKCMITFRIILRKIA